MTSELRSTPTALNSGEGHGAAVIATHNQTEKRHRSIFEVPANFFDSCRLLQSSSSIFETTFEIPKVENISLDDNDVKEQRNLMKNWTCNTCRTEFDSLQDQRSHFKSDIHRFNIKLSLAGKDIVNEEDFDESTSDALFKDNDISSISGSEDEDDKVASLNKVINGGLVEGNKRKIFMQLQTGTTVSIWKCLLMDESQHISFEHDKSASVDDGDLTRLTEREVIEKVNNLIHEPRDNTRFRVVLLARGGHFAACVFDGNSVVAHKTFHRYVIRARAGKKQSSKDASGKIAHSAGASIRRYNELALKKEIQELFTAWKPYFDASSCIFVHAPSSNRQLLFDGGKPYFSCQHHAVRNVPLTVRRPTLKEAKRLYSLLTQVNNEADVMIPILKEEPIVKEGSKLTARVTIDDYPGCNNVGNNLDSREVSEPLSGIQNSENLSISNESESESGIVHISTPLHEAAKSNDALKVMELLEEGLDPCIIDERGRTPYMLATEKEVRNTFRRFMASNSDKWNWTAAKVPSPLTKEMEEAQNAKQAEKDAKRKARAKELKKLRKEREKKVQAEAAQSVASTAGGQGQSQYNESPLSKEEELRKAQAIEREKRAAAAERRLAAASSQKASASGAVPSNSLANNVAGTDVTCSCCNASLAGKVPFHRYNYKYCSTSCMHVHREIIEDG